ARGAGRLIGERIADENSVFPLGTRRQQRHGRADELLDAAHILDGGRRKVDPRAGAASALRPTRHGLEDRLYPRLDLARSRQVVVRPALISVADADLDFRKAVEDVELCQRGAVDPAARDGLPHHPRIEPAAAPGAPGHAPELLASLAERAADLVVLLGRERAGSDPGGIGLGNAEHVADRSRPEPTA